MEGGNGKKADRRVDKRWTDRTRVRGSNRRGLGRMKRRGQQWRGLESRRKEEVRERGGGGGGDQGGQAKAEGLGGGGNRLRSRHNSMP